MPIMFGSNHENAFLDALVMTTCNLRFDHFLVRADVFNNPVAGFFLRSLNMMPVYRIRDGVSSVKDNDKAFEACYKILAKGESIIIFPEANHDMRRIRRVIKKGVGRIAFGALNYPGMADEMCIMPMGLNYSNHTAFRSAMHVVYGEPIFIKRQEATKEAIEDLRKRLNDAMNECHVSLNRENYNVLDTILFHDHPNDKLIEPKEINAKADAINEKLGDSDALLEAKKSLERRGVEFPYDPPKPIKGLLFIYLLPLAIVGAIINAPILFPLHWFVKNKIKDRAFKSSIYYGISIFTYPIWWGVLSSKVFNYTQDWMMALCVPVVATVTLASVGNFRNLYRRFKIRNRINSNDELKKDYEDFVNRIDELRNI